MVLTKCIHGCVMPTVNMISTLDINDINILRISEMCHVLGMLDRCRKRLYMQITESVPLIQNSPYVDCAGQLYSQMAVFFTTQRLAKRLTKRNKLKATLQHHKCNLFDQVSMRIGVRGKHIQSA